MYQADYNINISYVVFHEVTYKSNQHLGLRAAASSVIMGSEESIPVACCSAICNFAVCTIKKEVTSI